MNFWIPWTCLLVAWWTIFYAIPMAWRRIERRAAHRAVHAFGAPYEDDLGDVPGYRISLLMKQYAGDSEMASVDFERELDALIAGCEHCGRSTHNSIACGLVVQASADVLGQSSAGVLGNADLHEYARSLRNAPAFAGTPIYVFGSDYPYDVLEDV